MLKYINMQKHKLLSALLAVVLFLALVFTKYMNGENIFTAVILVPAALGGLIGGLAVYFYNTWLSKRKK